MKAIREKEGDEKTEKVKNFNWTKEEKKTRISESAALYGEWEKQKRRGKNGKNS